MSGLRIAMVGPTIEGGGVTSYLRRQATELETAGHRVDVIDEMAIDSPNPFAYGQLVNQIPRSADVIQVHFEAGLFGRLLVSGIGGPWFFHRLRRVPQPTVTTLHEVHPKHSHRGVVGDRLLRWRDWLLERGALDASDAVIVPSPAAAGVIRRRHGEHAQVEIRPHPVDADVNRIDPQEAKASFDLSGDILLTFGWVERKKKYGDVVEVLPELPDATYIIAGGKRPGEGAEVLDSVFDTARDLGVRDQVRYLGYVDDNRIDHLISAADAVVLPYDRVSQSGAINDGLAHVKPVVTTAIPFFESLRDEYGCLVCYEDRPELVAALESVLGDQKTRDRLSAATREYVRQHSWERFTNWIGELYRELG